MNPAADGAPLTPAALRQRFPWAPLGHWPTPLEPCDRLRAAIGGPRVWLKRDDCSGLALGGNKTRKLEYLIGEALDEHADGVVTFGALQSNHARQTAAACARYGLPCDVILTRAVPRDDEHYVHSGNVLLDHVLGAKVHVVADADEAFTRFAELCEAAEGEGRNLYGIGPGGSSVTGALGYVDGTLELADQISAAGLDVGRVCLAASTAGTAAGMVVGAAAAGLDAIIDLACVYEPAAETAVHLRTLVSATSERIGIAEPPESAWTMSDACIGGGYGVPTEGAMAAITLLARTEGVLLDPVYTAKAFAWLLHRIDTGEISADRDVVFLHTGGAPGLFAYQPALNGDGPRPE